MLKRNQLIIGITVFVLIIIGMLGYILYGKTQTTNPNSIPSNNKISSNASQNQLQTSIKDLFAGGQNRKCVFNVKGSGTGSTTGTVYVNANNAAGEFVMTTNGKDSKINLIKNNDTFYIWGDALPTGIKMTSSVDDMVSKMQQSQYGALNPNEKVNYNCSNWTVDQSMFKIPSSVKFIDAGTTIPKITGPNPTLDTSGYSCAGIKDPVIRATCESAMKK